MAGVVRFDLSLWATNVPVISEAASVAYDEALWQEIEVADAASDSQLSFGGVATVDVLYLISDQALTYNINSSSGTDLTLDANKPLFMAGTSVTALYVSNASGSTANVKYGIWGT